MAGDASFSLRTDLTSIAIMYKNRQYVADRVAPRVRVEGEKYEWTKFTITDGYQTPDDVVSRKGKPNILDFSSSRETGTVTDHALDTEVPNKDMENARNIPGLDPQGVATEQVMNLIELNRERRVASLVQTAGNFNDTVTLSGTDQFSDLTNSDPVDVITTGLSTPLVRPNVMVTSRVVMDVLQRHPKLINSVFGQNATAGIVPPEAIASLFGLDEVIVGDAWYNTAKKGQSASFGRVWGNHISLLRLSNSIPTLMSMTEPVFCATAQWGDRIAGTIPDSDIGARGGIRVRAGESVDEVLISNRAGYFIADAVA